MIHIEFLVEDQSGKAALDQLIPKVVPNDITFIVHPYRGIGRVPKGLKPKTDASKRILLDQLPRLIAGYGKAFANDPPDYTRAVVIVCDLDRREHAEFERDILLSLVACNPKPLLTLCLAVEEGEAWLLGDADAVMQAYPKANRSHLSRYVPDSICGTWEFLADTVEPGGAKALLDNGYHAIGRAKHQWATKISPLVLVERNRSPSFQIFTSALRDLLLFRTKN